MGVTAISPRSGALLALALLSAVQGTGPAASARGAGSAASCVACEAPREAVLARYETETLEALRAGEVRTWSEEDEEAPGRRVRAALVVDAPPPRVWEVLTAWRRWPEFLSRLKGIEVLDASDPVRLRHHVSVYGFDFDYGTVRTLEPRRGRIEVRLDPAQDNDLAANRTRWRLVPLDGGRRTLVEVRARVRTGRPIPGFVERMLIRRGLPAQLEAFRTEVRERGRVSAAG